MLRTLFAALVALVVSAWGVSAAPVAAVTAAGPTLTTDARALAGVTDVRYRRHYRYRPYYARRVYRPRYVRYYVPRRYYVRRVYRPYYGYHRPYYRPAFYGYGFRGPGFAFSFRY
jgi:hypothetical protein